MQGINAEVIREQILESIEVKQRLLSDEYTDIIATCAMNIAQAFLAGHSMLICGNGGSSADAMHIAAKAVARFEKDRDALPAIALNENSSTITAVGNDYEYDKVFARQVDAFGREGDVLLAISTSGNSNNVYLAMEHAKQRGMMTIGLLGKDGGRCLSLADKSIVVPAMRTARIQEAQIMVGHILCQQIEEALFGNE